jgi:hypothetical protein
MDVEKAALACFPKDYAESRRRFLRAAKAARASLRSYPNPNKGPAGEALATDCAWIGSKTAPHVLVLISATHGVEGFCGAGALMDFFTTRPRLPKNLAVLVVHAINPHGFAWLRRVTEEGVDLNRNFVDFAKPPENPGYEELRRYIVPDVLDGPEYDAALAKVMEYGQRHGQTAMNVAFSGGQYTDPKGVFYGGSAPTWSHRTHAAILADYAMTSRRRVAVLDYHTGLGPHGYCEVICAHQPDSSWAKNSRDWIGDSLFEPLAGKGEAGARHGLSSKIWEATLGTRLKVFLAMEYGTYDTMSVVRKALVADQWLHNRGPVKWSDKLTRSIKAEIRKAFYPDTDDWREQVLARSRQMIRLCIARLGAK